MERCFLHIHPIVMNPWCREALRGKGDQGNTGLVLSAWQGLGGSQASGKRRGRPGTAPTGSQPQAKGDVLRPGCRCAQRGAPSTSRSKTCIAQCDFNISQGLGAQAAEAETWGAAGVSCAVTGPGRKSARAPSMTERPTQVQQGHEG